MGKMLGSFVALDNLICFNAAFRNDFAEYNRTLIKAKNAGVTTVLLYVKHLVKNLMGKIFLERHGKISKRYRQNIS